MYMFFMSVCEKSYLDFVMAVVIPELYHTFPVTGCPCFPKNTMQNFVSFFWIILTKKRIHKISNRWINKQETKDWWFITAVDLVDQGESLFQVS